jgi:outer membrane protein assembly factor BamB
MVPQIPRLLTLIASLALAGTGGSAENWLQWRGPRMDGTSQEKNVPVQWGATSNILWKTAVPGLGHASPIVWGDRIFTVTCEPEKESRALLCFDANTGVLRWQTVVMSSMLEAKHGLNSHASSTPATDGQLVFSAFLDRSDMVVSAHDFAGRQRWQVRPGIFSSKHGFCSSPIVFKDKVILNGDHDGDGYLVALDRQTGKTLWKVDRPNKTRSYCAPAIFEIGGRTQMVLSGTKCVTSYDPNDGKLHWIIDGPTEQYVASLVYSRKANLVFMTAGFPEYHILAIDPTGQGNVTQTHVKWRTTKGAVYVPSPIVEGDYFLVTSEAGVAHCFEAATGKILWQERQGVAHASLVSAAGLVYFTNDEGVTHVVKPGSEYSLVARNELGEKVFASPALGNGRVYVRGFKNLYAIGQ